MPCGSAGVCGVPVFSTPAAGAGVGVCSPGVVVGSPIILCF